MADIVEGRKKCVVYSLHVFIAPNFSIVQSGHELQAWLRHTTKSDNTSRSSSSIRSEGLLHPRAAVYIRVQLRTYTRTTLRKQAVNTLRHSSLLIYFRVAKPL